MCSVCWFLISTSAFKISWSLSLQKVLSYPPCTAHVASWLTSIFHINPIPSSPLLPIVTELLAHCFQLLPICYCNCSPTLVTLAGSERFWGANQVFTDFHWRGIGVAPCQRMLGGQTLLFHDDFSVLVLTHTDLCPHSWYKYIQAKVIYV